jgi:hypothetical protein
MNSSPHATRSLSHPMRGTRWQPQADQASALTVSESRSAKSMAAVSWTPLAGGVSGAPSLHDGDRELGARSADTRRRPQRPPGRENETTDGDERQGSASTGGDETTVAARLPSLSMSTGQLTFLFPNSSLMRARQKRRETFGAFGIHQIGGAYCLPVSG